MDSELPMAIETPTMSTEQSPPMPNGVLTNQVVYGEINTNQNSQSTPSHFNGTSGENMNAISNPELAFDSIESTISAFSTEIRTKPNHSMLTYPSQKPAPSSSSSMPPPGKTKATSSAQLRTSPPKRQLS